MGLGAFAAILVVIVAIVIPIMMGISPSAVGEGIGLIFTFCLKFIGGYFTFIGDFWQAFGPLFWIILQVIGTMFEKLVSALEAAGRAA
jgi:hypothetical protein